MGCAAADPHCVKARSRLADAHFLHVLEAVADAGMRPSAVGRAYGDQNLVGAGRIRDLEIEREEMGAGTGSRLVSHRQGQQAPGRVARVGEAQIGGPACGLAKQVSKSQCVDQGGAVLDLAVKADRSAFPIGFDALRLHQARQPVGHHLAEDGRVFVDDRSQVFGEAAPCPGIRQDGRDCHGGNRAIRRLATLYEHFFNGGENLSDCECHA